MTFRPISDERVVHVWIDREGNTHEVPPYYYEQNGIPCEGDDGTEMSYHNTQIRYEDDKIAMLLEAAKPQDMFYTPENKEAADRWLEGQASVMPTSVSFMVGYNYAMNMVKRVLEADDLDALRAQLEKEKYNG